MLAKRPDASPRNPARVIPIHEHALQLEALYARRSAIETLIESLKDYDRFRVKRLAPQNQKTA